VPLSSVPIFKSKNFEDLQFGIDILNQNPFSRNPLVVRLVFLCQRVLFRLFLGDFTVCVVVANPLETTISLYFYILVNRAPNRILIHFEIVGFALVLKYSDNLIALPVDKDQGFYCVLLLFAGVVLFLFF